MGDSPGSTDAIGPVELIVLGFAGNRFTGEITTAVTELLEGGLVRIIDLAVISRDHDGTVAVLEMQEVSPDVATALDKLGASSIAGLLSEGDLEELAGDLAPGNTAATLLVEHVWASRFAKAVRSAGGELLLSERIPHDAVIEARETLLAVAG